MKSVLFALVLVLGSLGPTQHLCIGAHAAAAKMMQERSTPHGEWCQRTEANMPKEAHACLCHKTDCSSSDPNTLPAHTDSACLNFCTTANCECPLADCK